MTMKDVRWADKLAQLLESDDLVQLTALERGLLAYLADRPGQIVDQAELLREVWQYAANVRTRAVSNLVSRLRAKLGSEGDHLQTVYGQGYRLLVDPTPEHNLTPCKDRFVGRTKELTKLADLFTSGARLVTLTGPGGVGKSRLSLEYAHRDLARFPGGAIHCDLRGVNTFADFVHCVAQRSGVQLGSDDHSVQLAHMLAQRGRCLLVLDGFDHIRASTEPGGAPAIAFLRGCMERSDDTHLLITSRTRLRVREERLLTVPPLSHRAALALFEDRAAAAGMPAARLDEDAPVVEELVGALSHLPLAIELAAARTRVLSATELLSRLSHRFSLLCSTEPTGERTTLAQTLQWSWDLLKSPVQSALAQLSVFEGGFTLAAAEAVVHLPDGDVVDAIQDLVDASLVREVGPARFDLVANMHEIAAARLTDSDHAEEVSARHGAHFAALGTPAALTAMRRTGGVQLHTATWHEIGNLVVAVRRAVARTDPHNAALCAIAAKEVLQWRGPKTLARELLEAALGVAETEGSDRVRCLLALGVLCSGQGDDEAGLSHLRAARRGAEGLGDQRTEVLALMGLGSVHILRGAWEDADTVLAEAEVLSQDLEGFPHRGELHRLQAAAWERLGRRDQSLRRYYDALASSRADGHRMTEGLVHASLAWVLGRDRRLEEAMIHHDEAAAAFHELGNTCSMATLVNNLGRLHHNRGELRASRDAFAESLALSRRVGDRRGECTALANIADVDRVLGDLEAARVELHCGLHLNRQLGLRRGECFLLACLGVVNLDDGQLDAAEGFLREALALCHERDRPEIETWVLHDLARLYGERGSNTQALEVARTALDVARRVADPLAMGQVQGRTGLCCIREGDVEAGLALLDAGEALLRGSDPGSLTELLLDRAEALVWLGEADAEIEAALSEAEDWVHQVGCGPRAALVLRIQAIRDR